MCVGEIVMGKSYCFFHLSFITLDIWQNQKTWLLYGTEHSLVYDLIFYYHYLTVHNKKTVSIQDAYSE